ncbi:MAG: hypothetical protein JRH16_16295 [Deltaproteobacteria bacterium]|nr:hypothetical protein [Deltaproteobacteria bacterium]MBW2361743.1 hypothetical protein [Deltaproteobacteria bacterium]
MDRLQSRTRWGLAVGVLVASIAFGGLMASADEAASWDQERVTALAEKLAKAVKELYDAEYKAPDSFSGIGGGSERHEFMDRLRLIEHESRHLAASLEKGAKAKSTKGSVLRIRELNDDLAMYGRRMALLDPVLANFAAFEDLLDQILPFYGLSKRR